MRLLGCCLVAALLSACSLTQGDPFPLTGGQVTRGAAAEELARLAGVQHATRAPGYVGNVVRLDERHVMTVRHFFDADSPTSIDLGDGVTSTARVIQRGSDTEPMTWTLVSVEPPSSAPATSLERGGPVEAWQEVAVVGYSTKWSGDYSLEPVIVHGRLLPMPGGLIDELGDALLLDLGDHPERCQGLSGSPVLTRRSPNKPWRCVGLLEAGVETSRGDRLGLAVRLPAIHSAPR